MLQQGFREESTNIAIMLPRHTTMKDESAYNTARPILQSHARCAEAPTLKFPTMVSTNSSSSLSLHHNYHTPSSGCSQALHNGTWVPSSPPPIRPMSKEDLHRMNLPIKPSNVDRTFHQRRHSVMSESRDRRTRDAIEQDRIEGKYLRKRRRAARRKSALQFWRARDRCEMM